MPEEVAPADQGFSETAVDNQERVGCVYDAQKFFDPGSGKAGLAGFGIDKTEPSACGGNSRLSVAGQIQQEKVRAAGGRYLRRRQADAVPIRLAIDQKPMARVTIVNIVGTPCVERERLGIVLREVQAHVALGVLLVEILPDPDRDGRRAQFRCSPFEEVDQVPADTFGSRGLSDRGGELLKDERCRQADVQCNDAFGF
ncbi:hypothetical protein [Bradyrhizobium sp. 143]|uniref:hypothetical protein n=1 Tax=Bradyrhizobium sp. 143 TaxID=2782619 RepID=UPI001FFACEF2|nr:hypothetical protein [Bradyrhizobium sp. 143]MCK1708409.1 hypothetical protein [Bradyrhizobium sp. 143]